MKTVTKMNRFFIRPIQPLGQAIHIHFPRAGVPARPLASSFFAATLCALLASTAGTAFAAVTAITAVPPVPASTRAPAEAPLAESVSSMDVTLGKSVLLRLPSAAARLSVANPQVADVMLIDPAQIYVLGKSIGTTNVILWTRDGQTAIINVTVFLDAAALQSKLRELMPGEGNIKVSAAGDSLVLFGTVSDTLKADRAVALADAYVRASSSAQGGPQRTGTGGAGGNKGGQGGSEGGNKGGNEGGESQGTGQANIQVINLLQVGSNQQVMLEVKIAEINRTVAEKLGFDFQRAVRKAGSATVQIMTGVIGGAPGHLFQSLTTPGIGDSFLIDAEKKDDLMRILAEPNIVAISGQEASFLVGGEVMIPIPQFAGVITLQSRQFGVGLKFTPTVLDEGRINLVVSPEVTELVKFDTVATTGLGGLLAVPTFTTRRIATTVQLRDGQSLAIGGLLQDNIKEQVKRFPVLGEIPILGALFRSSDFQTDKTELMVVVTPRLITPLQPGYALPTNALVAPNRTEFLLEGKMEGSAKEPPVKTMPGPGFQPVPGDAGGFQMK